MTTDHEKFRKFFEGMGIGYYTYDHKKRRCWQCRRGGRRRSEPNQSWHCLMVSQAIFCFNREKRYLGVISDEMGFYKPRDKK